MEGNGYERIEDVRTITATLVLFFLTERERDACMTCGFRDRVAAEQPREYNSAGATNSIPTE